MLGNFFDKITSLSLRFKWITIGITAVIIAAGIYAMTGLNQELTPSVEFPQTIVVAQWPDAEDANQLLDEITIPLEEAFADIDGVVNVESTTSSGFAFVIVRNDFGEDQERIFENIQTAADQLSLPEGATTELLNFSLSDLPIVVASISSSELSLPELKELIEMEVQPKLAEVIEVSEVSVGGGQELPDPEAETAVTEETADPVEEEVVAEEAVDEDPGRLPQFVIEGAQSLDVEIEYAQDVTVELLTSLSDNENAAPTILSILRLIPRDVLTYLPADTISYLPSEYIDSLPEDIVANLNELSAEFGGTGQYSADEAVAILSGSLEEAPGDEVVEAPAEEVVEEVVELPEVTAVDLPESWITAAGAAGFELATTADITAEIMTGIVGIAPELLAELTPEMWRALSPDVLAVALPVAGPTLDPALTAQLVAIAQAGTGQVPEPVALPDEWVGMASAAGFAIETTADVPADAAGLIVGNAPELLETLTPEVMLGFSPEVLAVLPAEFVTTLDEGLQQTLANINVWATRYAAETAVVDAVVPELPAVPLPDSWIAGAAAIGQEIADTSDMTIDLMAGIVSVAPEQLAELTPEMWRAFDPAVTAVALPLVADSLDPELVTQLQAQEQAYLGETPEPAALPASWVAAAAGVGQEIETTADIPAEMFGQLVAFAPELLADLTPEMLLALSGEALAALPADYVATLDAGLQQTIGNIVILNEAFVLAQTEGEPVAEEVEPEPVDPARLPDVLIQGAASAGFEIENAQDISPEMIRLFAGLGPQGVQVLQLLTPDNLRLLTPEVIALLPAEFLEAIDAELLAELDTLAADFGGAGQLAIIEAEEAAQLAEGAPDLAGIWLEPSPEGEPSQFQTAADLLNNPFADGAAAFLNFFPTAPNVENPAEWMGALTPEVLQFLIDNEEGFVENLTPIVLELFSPEVLTYLLDNSPDAFEAELADRLRGIAQGDIEVFVPEASVTRTDGDPSVIVNVFKDGSANTVVVAHRVFDALADIEADHPELETTLVFEQATFIEDSIEGVSREGLLGALFAILVIMAFLSGRIGNKFVLSWRATLVTAVSIPLSIFAALLLMRIMPPTIGVAMENAAQNSDSGFLTFIARLFPSQLTLNIMTLSGLTVAIGRVVDDSIVVLENSYRYIQKGMDPREAVLKGTREVAVAIFSATIITMAVFLPLGLVGGIVGSFFLPFGLAVAYALAASFLVSITAVPALTYLVIRQEHIPDERETAMQRWYTPLLEWALHNRYLTMLIATLIFAASIFLMARLPQSFIPSFGEPTVNVSVSLPAGTQMVDTNELVEQFEAVAHTIEGVETIQTEIGSAGGFESFFGGGSVSQNIAAITITVEEGVEINDVTNEVRREAIEIFEEDNVVVSAASQTGFSGFELILTGDSLAELRELNEDVKTALANVDVDEDGIADIANISSNADAEGTANAETIIRIDGRPAISFGGDLETANTIGVTNEAKAAISNLSLPAGVEVTEGFDSEQQLEGQKGMITALGYSIIIAYLIMAITFRSLIHPFTILFSIPFALVGAAIALYITNSVLGISAMIGFMMLIGVVVTNGIVLMEMVQQLRESGTAVFGSLVEAGRTRLRPIWMTALTAILALIPLAMSSEAGAIIASELARAVMGGLIVSTALTLIVVPVVYSLSDQFANWVNGLIGRGSKEAMAD